MVGVPGRSNACYTCRERKIRVCEPHLLHNMAPITVYVVGSMLLIVFSASSAMVESRLVPAARGGRHACRGYERPRVFVNQFLTDDAPTGSCVPLRNGRWRIYVKPRSRPSLPDRAEVYRR